MRDPARIDRILARLAAYWHAYPDLRLGQIVSNAARDASPFTTTFYVEDDVIERSIPDIKPENIAAPAPAPSDRRVPTFPRRKRDTRRSTASTISDRRKQKRAPQGVKP